MYIYVPDASVDKYREAWGEHVKKGSWGPRVDGELSVATTILPLSERPEN